MIAQRHAAPAGDLAGAPRTRLDESSVGVDHARRGRQRERRAALPAFRAEDAGLARAEGVHDAAPGEQVQQAILVVLRQTGAARRDDPQGGKVVLGVRRQLVQQRLGHRVTHDDEGEDLLGGAGAPDLRRVEAAQRQQDDAPAGQELVEGQPVPGGVHQRRGRERGQPRCRQACGQLLRRRADVAALEGVAPAHRRREDVGVPPDHALRQPRGATGVDQVDVVGGATGHPRARRIGGREHGLVVLPGVGLPGVVLRGRGAAVVDDQERPQRAATRQGRRDPRREAAVVQEGHDARVVVEVPQLALDVPVVDVHGDGAQLERREHPLEVFAAVGELQPHRVTGTDAARGQGLREPGGTPVEGRVGQPALPDHEHLAVGIGVGDGLEEIGEVLAAHARTLTHRQVFVRGRLRPPGRRRIGTPPSTGRSPAGRRRRGRRRGRR